MSNSYTTQEMANLTGFSIHTLRYYENIGLLDEVTRLDNGHRRYDDLDLRRLNFVKRLKATGMPISEMVYYVELFREGDSTMLERYIILREHRAKVQAQVDELYETLDFLDMKLRNYEAQGCYFDETMDTSQKQQETT